MATDWIKAVKAKVPNPFGGYSEVATEYIKAGKHHHGLITMAMKTVIIGAFILTGALEANKVASALAAIHLPAGLMSER